MSTSFLPTWLYNDQKIFELELDNYAKNYWHPLIFIGEIKPGEILEKKFFNQIKNYLKNTDLKPFLPDPREFKYK